MVTHECGKDKGFASELVLPRFEGVEGEDQIRALLNEVATSVEDIVNRKLVTEDPCNICVANGAIVIDCFECTSFDITVNATINSISFINCDRPGQEVTLFFESSGAFKVSGFPSANVCPACGDISNPIELDSGDRMIHTFRTNLDGNPTSHDNILECLGACLRKKLALGIDCAVAFTDCYDECAEATIGGPCP